MAASNSTHVCSTNTLAYFTDWAKSISDFMASINWVQANVPGQVVWVASVFTNTITDVALVSGTTYRYTYSALTSGPVLRVGMNLIISGFAGGLAGNNIAGGANIVALGASTFDVVNATGVPCSGQACSATTTALAAAPGTSTYVYEIWGMGDALQATSPFYLDLAYGTGTSANGPELYVQLGTAPGATVNPLGGNYGTSVRCGTDTDNTTTPKECDYSGDTSRVGIIMWRNTGGSPMSRIFCVDRSKDASGNDTGDYATLITCGYSQATQQTVFKAGTLQPVSVLETGSSSRWATVLPITFTTGNVNNNIFCSPVYPLVGQVDNPSLMAMVGLAADWAENAAITVTVYGTPHTYKFTKSTGIPVVGSQGVGYPAIRYE